MEKGERPGHPEEIDKIKPIQGAEAGLDKNQEQTEQNPVDAKGQMIENLNSRVSDLEERLEQALSAIESSGRTPNAKEFTKGITARMSGALKEAFGKVTDRLRNMTPEDAMEGGAMLMTVGAIEAAAVLTAAMVAGAPTHEFSKPVQELFMKAVIAGGVMGAGGLAIEIGAFAALSVKLGKMIKERIKGPPA